MTSLPTRTIGPFTVSAIGLGCMNLSHAYGVPATPEEGARLLNRALDLGVTLLDSAALYGNGANERLIAGAVMHRRAEFTLASKCVLDMIDGKRTLDGRPETIAGSLERSLQRLGTDHIDLYYMHRLDKQVPIEESVGALVRAKEAGKIGAIGLSEMSAESVRRAHAVHPVAAVQTEYSPMVRNAEIAVLDACRELKIGFVAFSPMVRGLLADGVRDDGYAAGDIRLNMPRFVEPNLSHNMQAVGRVQRAGGGGGVHAGAALDRLGAVARRPCRADPGHARRRASRGGPGCARRGRDVRAGGADRGDLRARRDPRRALCRGAAGADRYRSISR